MRKTILLIILAWGLMPSIVWAQTKKIITSADQLPRRTIALTGKAMDIYQNDAMLNELAAAISRNLEEDLAAYDIQDKATLKSYYSTLMLLDLRAGRDKAVLDRISRLVTLEDKPEEKSTTGLMATAYVKARQQTGTSTGETFLAAFEKNYAEAVNTVPQEYRQKYIEQNKASLMMINPEATLAAVSTQIQPFIDNGKGQVPESIPMALISTKTSMQMRLPVKEHMLRVLESFSAEAAQPTAKQNIWLERNAAIKPTAKGVPVKVAVWDSGVDTKIYANHLHKNTKEVADNGKDDDNNGFVDDVHGIAYNPLAQRTTGSLLKERKPVYSIAELQRWAKGSMDMQSGIPSAEARELQQKVAALKPDETIPFQEDLTWYSVYSHGTHVAGIVAEGNPFVRLMYARLSYDTSIKPPCPTDQTHANTVNMYKDIISYFKQNGVKVVNMSWRYSAAGYEALLNMYGVGKDEQERKAIALKWFNAEKAALRESMQAAPEILFVCGSGNENNDANFQDYIPAGIDLPNVLTVGAVNSEGKRTTFTTEGKSVDLFANGYEVESFVPGGDRVKFSGTSMSSPQVANTAAKMLALNPSLKPAQLVAILQETATPSPESATIRLLHPQQALEKALQLRKDYQNNPALFLQTAR